MERTQLQIVSDFFVNFITSCPWYVNEKPIYVHTQDTFPHFKRIVSIKQGQNWDMWYFS
jgi:hypothetical protein